MRHYTRGDLNHCCGGGSRKPLLTPGKSKGRSFRELRKWLPGIVKRVEVAYLARNAEIEKQNLPTCREAARVRAQELLNEARSTLKSITQD